MAKKLNLKDAYQIACGAVVLITMGACFLHREAVRGVMTFKPRDPGKQWWAMASMVIMSFITGKVISKDKSKAIEHATGIMVLFSFILGGTFEYFQIEVGSQFWTVVGGIVGTWIGTKSSE